MSGAVIGVDQSARHSGVAVISSEGALLFLAPIKPPKKLKDAARLQYIHQELEAICVKYGPFSAGVLEGYSYNSVNRKFLLGEVGGVIKLTLSAHTPRVIAMSPKGLKKFTTGLGSAQKKDVMDALRTRWSVITTNDNLADAYGLARVAYALSYKPEGLTRAALEALHTLNED